MSVTQSDNCFVLMPFGRKANPFPGPSQIDFDRVYEKLVEPAVLKANLKPLRADQEISSGLIHLAMFERLLLCDFAIADLTTANPNVYYELGIRHAVRPWSTVLICGSTSRLPFDIEMSRTYLYAINDRGELSNPQNDIREIQARLEDVRQRIVSNSVTEDSPLFTLLSHEGYGGPDLTKLHATLRNRIDRCNEFEKLRNDIALSDVAHLREIQNRHPPGIIENAPIAVELLTAFRRAADWDDIIALVKQMPVSLQKAVSVQEQYGMALGRRGDFVGAEGVFNNLLVTRGPTALTYCFLGVVRKLRLLDDWEKGRTTEAKGALNNAIDAFQKGFKLDPRFIFAGINTVLLMTIRDSPDEELNAILPVVRYFIREVFNTDKAAFWEHAAALEMAVLENDPDWALTALDRMRVDAHEPWMPVSTLANLKLLRECREKRGEAKDWYVDLQNGLQALARATVVGAL